MLYYHLRTGETYRKIMEGFSVELQEPVVIFMSMFSGVVFTRIVNSFNKNFKELNNPMDTIEPKGPTYIKINSEY